MDMIDNLMAISASIDGCSALVETLGNASELSLFCQNAIYSIVVLLNAISQNLGSVIADMEAQS